MINKQPCSMYRWIRVHIHVSPGPHTEKYTKGYWIHLKHCQIPECTVKMHESSARKFFIGELTQRTNTKKGRQLPPWVFIEVTIFLDIQHQTCKHGIHRNTYTDSHSIFRAIFYTSDHRVRLVLIHDNTLTTKHQMEPGSFTGWWCLGQHSPTTIRNRAIGDIIAMVMVRTRWFRLCEGLRWMRWLKLDQ